MSSSTTPTLVEAKVSKPKTVKGKRYILVLPIIGLPYIQEELSSNEKNHLAQLQKGVEGDITTAPINYYTVSESLVAAYPKWAVVSKMLKKGISRGAFCNEDGMRLCQKSGAFVLKPMGDRFHCLSDRLYGNVILVLTEKKMASYGIVASEWLEGGLEGLLASACKIAGVNLSGINISMSAGAEAAFNAGKSISVAK